MKILRSCAVLVTVATLLAGCATTQSIFAKVKTTTATVTASPIDTPATRAIPCGHPVVAHPNFTAEEDFFPKGAPARPYVDSFALVRTVDGRVGLNPLFPSNPTSTQHPPFDGQPFNIIVTRAVGNAVTITVPKSVAPYRGTPISGIDNSAASVAKYFPPVKEVPDHPMGPISTMQLGEVRHALDFSVYADQNGCYYLDTRANSWRDQVGIPAEVAIKRIHGGFIVFSATAKWQAFYPTTINKTKGVAAAPAPKQDAARLASLPLPALPKCPNQYSYPIRPLTGSLLGPGAVCVMVGISYRNLKRTTVTLTVRTPGCGPPLPAETTILQGTGSKTLLVVQPCGGSDNRYSLSYSRPIPQHDIRIRAATELKD